MSEMRELRGCELTRCQDAAGIRHVRRLGLSANMLTSFAGLDATIFLRCMAMLRWMFLSITVVVGIPALAANWYINNLYATKSEAAGSANPSSDPGADDDIDLLIFTAANASGNAMSAHVIFECLTTCLVILFGESNDQYNRAGVLVLILHSVESHVRVSTTASDLVPDVGCIDTSHR